MSRSHRKSRRKHRPKGKHGTGARIRVKGHTRTPRGSDSGKKAVQVRGYTRRKGRPK